jgi:hypothetical protein
MDLTTAQNWLKSEVGHRNKWREEANKADDFVAGEQWAPEERQAMEDNQRPTTVFNRIAPIVDAIVGHETANRQSVAYLPRQLGATQIAETVSAAARWVRDECGAEGEESDAFGDCVKTGEGWIDTEIEYEEDIDGKVTMCRVDPREMDIDPSSQKKNYLDAKWLCRTQKMDKTRASERWPDAQFESTSRSGGSSPIDVIAAAFYHSNSGSEGREGAEQDLVLIHDFQWWELETVYRVPAQVFQMVPQVAQAIAQTMPEAKPSESGMSTFTEEQWNAVKGSLPPDVKPTTQKRRKYMRMFWSGPEELETKPTPTKVSFTYSAITAKRDRKKRCWYGIVRAMCDPQRWSNKFMSLALEVMSTSAKGGIMAEIDAFNKPRDAEADWADPSRIIYMKSGALAAGKVQPRPSTPLPESANGLMMYANQSINDTAGVNPAVMGFSKELDVSGVLEQTRLQAGLNLLSYLFDGLRRYRKQQGVVLMVMIREYIPPGRLIKVEGQEGAQYVPLAFDPAIDKYDIVVDEAPTAPNVKTQTWESFIALAPHLPPTFFTPQFLLPLLQYSPFPSGLVQQWQKMTSQPPSPQQQQAQQIDTAIKVGTARKVNAEADLKSAEARDVGQGDPMDIASKLIGVHATQIKADAEVTAANAKAHQTHLDTQSAMLQHHLETQGAIRDATLAEQEAQRRQQQLLQPQQPNQNPAANGNGAI